jgi:hypothetical protein
MAILLVDETEVYYINLGAGVKLAIPMTTILSHRYIPLFVRGRHVGAS